MMSKRLSRPELIAIAKKLKTDNLGDLERSELSHAFEESVPHPDGTNLLFDPKYRFMTLDALLDYALAYTGPAKFRKLSRQELIDITEKLMTANVRSDFEADRLIRQFVENVPHPDGSDLIFYPKIRFKTAEELVDYALAYKKPNE